MRWELQNIVLCLMTIFISSMTRDGNKGGDFQASSEDLISATSGVAFRITTGGAMRIYFFFFFLLFVFSSMDQLKARAGSD